MKFIKELFDKKEISILILILPYFGFNYETIVHSPFFSYTQLISIFACLLFIDVFIKWILSKLNGKSKTIISLIVIFTTLVFFYGLYITNYTQKLMQDYFGLPIRGRTIIVAVVLLFVIILFLQRRKKINFLYLNVFMLIFCVLAIVTSIVNIKEHSIIDYQSKYTHIPRINTAIKPVILLISDEYSSPDGLYKVYKDSSIYDFSNKLVNKGWVARNSFYSYEISTIYSLSSLFNFNLSINRNYNKQSMETVGESKIMHAGIAASLEKKNVNIINFGIVHIGKHSFLNRLYYYPTSFIENIMMNTIHYTIKSNTDNFNLNALGSTYYPMEVHNKYILNNLSDTINKNNKTKTFIYAHLFMPHAPMQFKPEFPLRTENTLIDYMDYWKFSNLKLEALLTELTKENKYRIILSGDHGFRGDKRINPYYTFTAFYGFDQSSIDSIKSVQDLGSLINSCF